MAAVTICSDFGTQENKVHICNGILPNQYEERNNALYANTDGPGDYYTKWS